PLEVGERLADGHARLEAERQQIFSRYGKLRLPPAIGDGKQPLEACKFLQRLSLIRSPRAACNDGELQPPDDPLGALTVEQLAEFAFAHVMRRLGRSGPH